MEGITQDEIPSNKIDLMAHSSNQELSANSLEEDQQIQKALHRFGDSKVDSLQNEVNYLRQLIDFQNTRIDKLTTLVTEFIENKNHDSLISSIQQLHDHNQQQQEQQHHQHHQQQLHQILQHQQQDSNMDPALHQVAVAAVAAAEREKPIKKRKSSFNDSINDDSEFKKPKIDVAFLHNPTTVKEIHDEFTKGFKGQPPLSQMDAKYGKHEWRGDSRSKESKRYQRRKKLCDAIERGMIKYSKSAEDIIAYIEEFRGDKSLTWVMNGNLPPDIAQS